MKSTNREEGEGKSVDLGWTNTSVFLFPSHTVHSIILWTNFIHSLSCFFIESLASSSVHDEASLSLVRLFLLWVDHLFLLIWLNVWTPWTLVHPMSCLERRNISLLIYFSHQFRSFFLVWWESSSHPLFSCQSLAIFSLYSLSSTSSHGCWFPGKQKRITRHLFCHQSHDL